MPEAGVCVLMPASDDGFVMTVVDGDRVLGEEDVAVGVAEFTYANEGGSKRWHDVAESGCVIWELG